MALKKKINKTQFDKLGDQIKEFYVEGSGGDYILDLDGDDDVGALMRAKEHEVAKRKDETRKRKELELRLKELEDKELGDKEEASRQKGDIEALEASWKAKNKKIKDDKDAEINLLKSHLTNLLVDSVAESISRDISTSPKLMIPFIKDRLTVDLDGDKPSTRILDADGQMSALSIDELKAEFQANTDFSAVLIASKASGGAKAGDSTDRKIFPTSGGKEPTSLLDMSDEELTATIAGMRED